MMTLPQIIRRTPRQRIEAAKYVKLLNIKKGYNEQGHGFIAAQTYSTHVWSPATYSWVRSRDRSKYISVVVFVDNSLHCKVSCSCPDFTFRSEVALAEQGAADIEYSNGQPPTSTNPNMVPQTCKHIVRLYLSIKDKIKK